MDPETIEMLNAGGGTGIRGIINSILFVWIPGIVVVVGVPTFWLIQGCFSIASGMLAIMLYPFFYLFRIVTWPLRVAMSLLAEIQPLIEWLGNAILIGITTGGFLTLLTMFIMNIIDVCFPFLGSREPEIRRSENNNSNDNGYSVHQYNNSSSNNGNGNGNGKDGVRHISFREPIYTKSSHSPNSGRPLTARARMAPVPPMMGRRMTPPRHLVPETIQEEEDSE